MPGEHLKSILDQTRPQLETGLAAAEAELEELDARRAELLQLIARARAALGVTAPAPEVPRAGGGDSGLTLHEALAQVLREHGNEWMTVRELAAEVNTRGLYRKRDGSPVEANQVHARAKNYAAMFEKDGPRVRLVNA